MSSVYDFFTANCVAPYKEQFTNEFGGSQIHCYTLDTIQLFQMPSDFDDQMTFFTEDSYKLRQQVTDMRDSSQSDLLNIMNKVRSLQNATPVESLFDGGGILTDDLTVFLKETNDTLTEVYNWRHTMDDYAGKLERKYPLKNNVTLNICKVCQMWVDDETKAMVMCSCYRVMFPSLLLFTVITLGLHFLSTFTSSTQLRRGKRKIAKMKNEILGTIQTKPLSNSPSGQNLDQPPSMPKSPNLLIRSRTGSITSKTSQRFGPGVNLLEPRVYNNAETMVCHHPNHSNGVAQDERIKLIPRTVGFTNLNGNNNSATSYDNVSQSNSDQNEVNNDMYSGRIRRRSIQVDRTDTLETELSQGKKTLERKKSMSSVV